MSAAPQVFEPVLARLLMEATEHFGTPSAQLLPLAYEERPYSHLLRVRVSHQGLEPRDSHLFIKIFKPKPRDGGVEKMRLRVEQDFHTTRHIYESMSQCGELGAVRPVACYADHLAIVTEQAEGHTLLAHLKEHAAWFPTSSTRNAITDTMMAVGRWLRAFQSIDGGFGEVSIADLRSYVDLRLKRLVEQAAVFTESDRQKILRHLDSLGREVPPTELREVIVHADLALGNILVSGRRVVVLDFAMSNRGSYLHDVSRLFLQLDLLRAKPQFRSEVIRALQLALLRGLDPSLTPHRPLFRFLLMLHHINHLGTLSLRRERFPASVFSGHIRRAHRRWIDQELRTGAVVQESS